MELSHGPGSRRNTDPARDASGVGLTARRCCGRRGLSAPGPASTGVYLLGACPGRPHRFAETALWLGGKGGGQPEGARRLTRASLESCWRWREGTARGGGGGVKRQVLFDRTVTGQRLRASGARAGEMVYQADAQQTRFGRVFQPWPTTASPGADCSPRANGRAGLREKDAALPAAESAALADGDARVVPRVERERWTHFARKQRGKIARDDSRHFKRQQTRQAALFEDLIPRRPAGGRRRSERVEGRGNRRLVFERPGSSTGTTAQRP